MNFGFAILDLGLRRKDVTKLIRSESLSVNNPESKIQNLRWVAIFAIVFASNLCGAVAQAQQPTKVPRIGCLRVVALEADSPGTAVRLKEYEAAAGPLKLEVHSLNVQTQNPDLSAAFHSAGKERVTALITVRDALFYRFQKQIAELAIKHRLSSMFERSDYVEAGALISYAADDAEINQALQIT